MASGLTRVGDLDINQDLRFQYRIWTAQRVGWAMIGLLALAALAGAFGDGLLSRTAITGSSLPLSLEYERFTRYQSLSTLRIHLNADAFGDGRGYVWISREYLARVQIQAMTPIPRRAEVSPTGVTYEFEVGEPPHGGEVILHLELRDFGLLSGRLGLSPSRSMPFQQWVYP